MPRMALVIVLLVGASGALEVGEGERGVVAKGGGVVSCTVVRLYWSLFRGG